MNIVVYENRDANNSINLYLNSQEIEIRTDHVNMLISHGAHVNEKDKDGNSPLHYACRYGYNEIAKLLLSHGASINEINKNGCSPLYEAFIKEDDELSELLMAYYVNTDDEIYVGGHYMTQLYIACRFGCVKMIESLMVHGANINRKNYNGETILYDVCRWGNHVIAEILINYGACVSEINNYGNTPLHDACWTKYGDNAGSLIKLLIDNGANVNANGGRNGTPIFTACWAQSDFERMYVMAKLLIDNGADVNEKNIHGITPLHILCHRGNHEMIRFLIAHNADLNGSVSCNGSTPFHSACQIGDQKTIELLMSLHANIFIKNKKGQTPAMLARDSMHERAAIFLEKEIKKRIYILSLIIQYDVMKYYIMKKID